MTSVAYTARPPLPGWLRTAWVLLLGWLGGAVGVGVIYVIARLIGVVGTNAASHAGVLNEWPYPDNGAWSFAANLAVILLALLVTTAATASSMRPAFARFSESRLAVVLLFTGWIPLVTEGPIGGLFGFVLAVVLVRRWVAAHDDHLSRRGFLAAGAALVVVIGAYGLSHPLWLTDAYGLPSGRGGRTLTIVVQNAGRLPVTVERFDAGLAFGQPRPATLRIPAESEGSFLQPLPAGCFSLLPDIHVRYRLLGLTLSARLQARPRGVPRCR